MSALQLVLGGLFLGSLVWGVVGYPKGYGALSGRSRLFRTAGIALLILLLALGFFVVGAAVPHGDKMGAIRKAALLLSCLLVALSLCGIALLDGLESYVVVRRERRGELNKVIADTVAAAERQKAEDAETK